MTSGIKDVFNYAAYLPAKATLRNAEPWVALALAVILGLSYIYRRYNTSVETVPLPKDLDMPKKNQPAYYQAPNEGENRWSTLPQPVIQVIFALVDKDTRITSRRVCKTWNIALTTPCAVLPDLIDVRTIPIFHEINNCNSAKSAYRSLKKSVAHVGGRYNQNTP